MLNTEFCHLILCHEWWSVWLLSEWYVGWCEWIDSQSPEIIATYSEHGSLVYGADWCRSSVNELPQLPAGYDSAELSAGYDSVISNTLPDGDGPSLKKSAVDKKNITERGREMHSRSLLAVNKDDLLIASCSFYDRQLRVLALTNAAVSK